MQVPSRIAEEAPAAALGPGREGRIQPWCRAAEHQPELCNISYNTRNRAGLPWFQVSHHTLGFSQVTQACTGEIWGVTSSSPGSVSGVLRVLIFV